MKRIPKTCMNCYYSVNYNCVKPACQRLNFNSVKCLFNQEQERKHSLDTCTNFKYKK